MQKLSLPLTYCRIVLFPLLTCVLMAQQLPLKQILTPAHKKGNYCKMDGSGCSCGHGVCMCGMKKHKPDDKMGVIYSGITCQGHNMADTMFIFTLSKIFLSQQKVFTASFIPVSISVNDQQSYNFFFVSGFFRPPQFA